MQGNSGKSGRKSQINLVNCTKKQEHFLLGDKWKIIAYFGTRSYNLESGDSAWLRISKKRGVFTEKMMKQHCRSAACPPARNQS